MLHQRWSLGFLGLLLAVSALPAQPFPFPQAIPVPVVLVPAPGLSIRYAKVSRHSAFALSYNSGGYGFYGPAYGSFASPFFSTGYTQVILQGPPVIIPAPAGPVLFPADGPLAQGPIGQGVLAGRLLPDGPPPGDDFPPRQIERPLPGREAGAFRPLDPDNRERARRPVPPPPPKQEEKPKVVPPPPPPPPPDRLLPRQPPNPDPRQESVRQLEIGKEVFARGEYGRAAERFRHAIDLAPNAPLPYFLLAQSHIALGNYRRAFDTLQVALRLQPDWPSLAFRPIELYGDVAEHAEHTQALEDLLSATPDDPVILFLTAYQLWIDGRREEARPLLQRAAPVLPDPSIVEQFLRALPGGDIL